MTELRDVAMVPSLGTREVMELLGESLITPDIPRPLASVSRPLRLALLRVRSDDRTGALSEPGYWCGGEKPRVE